MENISNRQMSGEQPKPTLLPWRLGYRTETETYDWKQFDSMLYSYNMYCRDQNMGSCNLLNVI